MTVQEYITLAVSKIDPTHSVDEWYKDLTTLYEELESAGNHHADVFAMINKAIINRLHELHKTLNDLTK